MGQKPTPGPGLTSPDASQDVEFTIDKQIDERQREREEHEGRGPLGPPKMEKRYKSDPKQFDADEDHKTRPGPPGPGGQ